MQLINSKLKSGKKMIRAKTVSANKDSYKDLQNMCSFCARTVANLIHVNSPGGSTSAC